MSGKDDHKPTEPKSTGTAPRDRTTSESDDGTTTGKRQRTTSAQFMVASGMTSASPPKFVSLEEIMQAANGLQDMALIHNIVVDEDFHLKKAEPEPNTVQSVVKETLHRAFWDILREELNETPPNYTQALVLLEDVKEGLYSLLLPQHTKIRQQIAEVLDTQLIKQQAEKGVLDFARYAQFVIGIMAMLCAPVRDDKIKELTATTDVVETFRGILELLDLMQLDMANFTLKIFRPDIIANSVELERQKFSEFLAVQTDGLQITKKWLLKHVDTNQQVPNDDYDGFIKKVYKNAFREACVDLIDPDVTKEVPETFMLDRDRIRDLLVTTERLITTATVLIITLSNVNTNLHTIGEFKRSLIEHITILLESANNAQEFANTLPNITEQVISEVKAALDRYELPELNPKSENSIKQQISEIFTHKVRALVKQRVKEFYLDILESATAAPQKMPAGLTSVEKPLIEVAGQLLRIVAHNDTVFCIYYHDIVSEALPKPT